MRGRPGRRGLPVKKTQHSPRADHRQELAHFQAWQALAGRPAKASRNGNGRKPAADLLQRNLALEAELAALRRQQNELQQALFGAAQLQRRLCSTRELRRGRFELASEVFAVRHISGDFYNVLDLGSELALAVGDIAGKGFLAGLWFTHLIGLLRIHAASVPGPAAATAAINRDLFQIQPDPPMAGLFLGRLDPHQGDFIYCNAGQPPALLLRRNGSVETLREGGPMLGAVAGATFNCGRVRLESGDTLVMYSDGLTECRNACDEEFGTRGLLAAARAAAGSSANSMLFSLLGSVQDFAGSHPRGDDLTLMVLRHL